MPVDEQHQAFPKLYGAPAYARPPAPVAEAGRPFDPDDLPLAAALEPDERAALEAVRAGGPVPSAAASRAPSASPPPGAPVGHAPSTLPAPDPGPNPALRPRPFDLRSLAARLGRRG